MNKNQTMFDIVEDVVNELRELEPDDERPGRLFTIRRRLQEAQNDYLKQGDRVLITKEFKIECTECNQPQMREEDYYLHLRQKHKYSDEEAASESNEPLRNYEEGIQSLKKGLREFTQVMLEETASV